MAAADGGRAFGSTPVSGLLTIDALIDVLGGDVLPVITDMQRDEVGGFDGQGSHGHERDQTHGEDS